MFRIGSWPRGPFSVSFGRVADGPVWTRSAQILTEVLEGEVARRFEARLKRFHDNDWVLGRREDRNRWAVGDKKRGRRRYQASKNRFFSLSLSYSMLSKILFLFFLTIFFPISYTRPPACNIPFAYRQLWQQKPFLLGIWRWWEWLSALPQQSSGTSLRASPSDVRPCPADSVARRKWNKHYYQSAHTDTSTSLLAVNNLSRVSRSFPWAALIPSQYIINGLHETSCKGKHLMGHLRKAQHFL